jgi:hypothetical protein
MRWEHEEKTEFDTKKAPARVPAVKQVRNEICPYGQMKSLRGEIFAPQM